MRTSADIWDINVYMDNIANHGHRTPSLTCPSLLRRCVGIAEKANLILLSFSMQLLYGVFSVRTFFRCYLSCDLVTKYGTHNCDGLKTT